MTPTHCSASALGLISWNGTSRGFVTDTQTRGRGDRVKRDAPPPPVSPSQRRRVIASPRFALPAFLFLAALPLCGQIGPPEIEEAAEVARRAATAAIRGPQRVFAEALDVDALLVRRVGVDAWQGLTERQREQLRSAVRERFLQTLAPPRSAAGEIAWAAAQPSGSGVDVFLGLRFGEKTLKTHWAMRRVGAGWRVADIVLSDPGISLAQAAARALGPEPVRRREAKKQARSVAYPRLAGLAAIVLMLLLVAPRLSPPKRTLLFLTAAAPAILFLVDGILAVRRALSEPYGLQGDLPREPWRRAEQLALQAEREGHPEEAREHWARALAAGDQPAPIEYQLGLGARKRGELKTARASFERALSHAEPAPGAAKELATMALADGQFERAEQQLARYLSLTGPDPDSLSLLAVVKTNLGKTAEALEAVSQARRLVGEGWRAAQLEAQVHARAGDALGTVSALRPLEAQGLLDRSLLRADPAYLPIATDPAWVSFLNEKPQLPKRTPAAEK